MKVLHVIAVPGAGGAEVFVKDLLLNSRAAGIEARVLFTSDAKGIGRCPAYEEEFLKQLKENEIDFCVLPPKSTRRIWNGYKTFKSYVREFEPDCIHSHLQLGIIYAYLCCRKTPLAYTHHNSVLKSNPTVFKALLRCCNLHIAISALCADSLEKYLPRGRSWHVVYNAIDQTRLKQRNGPFNKQPQLLLAVGALIPQKNYMLMLRCISIMKQKLGSCFLLRIAGEGYESVKIELQDYIRQHDLSDVVELLGNRSDVPDLMTQSDVFLMSSAWEGLPIALLEAQISGVPAVVTDVGGCKEVLDITGGGVAVEAENPDALASALIDILTNPQEQASYSKNALQHREFFSIANCLEKHRECYSIAAKKTNSRKLEQGNIS